MPAYEQAHILAGYSGLMEEIKTRLAVIKRTLEDGERGEFAYEPYILGELCYLQLRMICETIALGCLLVHGDIGPTTRTARMRDAYSADLIIRRLTALHPNFYPVPARRIAAENKELTIEMRPETKPYLSKEKLMTLYFSTFRFLHRGTLEAILASDKKAIDVNHIAISAGEIATLLSHHQIPLIDSSHHLFVVMQDTDGRVRTFAMERVG